MNTYPASIGKEAVRLRTAGSRRVTLAAVATRGVGDRWAVDDLPWWDSRTGWSVPGGEAEDQDHAQRGVSCLRRRGTPSQWRRRGAGRAPTRGWFGAECACHVPRASLGVHSAQGRRHSRSAPCLLQGGRQETPAGPACSGPGDTSLWRFRRLLAGRQGKQPQHSATAAAPTRADSISAIPAAIASTAHEPTNSVGPGCRSRSRLGWHGAQREGKPVGGRKPWAKDRRKCSAMGIAQA